MGVNEAWKQIGQRPDGIWWSSPGSCRCCSPETCLWCSPETCLWP